MRPSDARDESGRRCAWRRWHESWSATFIGSGCLGARGGVSASSSPTSRTLEANASARSSPRSQPSSFRCDPQPDVLTTTRSTFANASINLRANALPSSRRPACTDSAPQHPCGGATTSKPSAARTRAVAALTSGKTALWTQPVRRPTRARRMPCSGRDRCHVAVSAPARRDLQRAAASGSASARLARRVPAGAPLASDRGRGGDERGAHGRNGRRADRSSSSSTAARVLSISRS